MRCSNYKQVEAFIDSLDTELFKSLSEPVRCSILKTLALSGPAEISDIARRFSQDRSVISRHLKQMELSGLVSSVKQGRSVIYQLSGEVLLEKLQSMVERLRFLVGCTDESELKE